MTDNREVCVDGRSVDERMGGIIADLAARGWGDERDQGAIADIALDVLRQLAAREEWSHSQWLAVMWAASFRAQQ